MPMIKFSLQTISLCQQGSIFGCEVVDDLRKTFPETVAVDASAGKDFFLDELMQNGCHLHSVAFGACCHDDLPVKKIEWLINSEICEKGNALCDWRCLLHRSETLT